MRPARERLAPASIRTLAGEREALMLGFVLAAGLVFALTNPTFLTVQNVRNIGVQSSMTILVALGMTIVIVSGGIDLSVGAVAAVASVVSVWLITNHVTAVLAALGAAVVATAALGLVNGLAIAYLRIPDFIATLAMMTSLRGAAYLISGGFTIRANDPQLGELANGSIGPFPLPVLIVVAAFALSHGLLRHTPLGRWLYAVGSGRDTARLAGLPVARIAIIAYVASGLLAGVAGLIAAARTQAGSPIIGTGWELQAITIVILGGTNLFGGSGSVTGTLLAGLLIGELNNWVSLQAYPDWAQGLVQGLILIAAVALSQRHLRARQRAARQRAARRPLDQAVRAR